jgi:hypothetical protein
MHGTMTLYIDQYGGKIWARTVRELHAKAGPGRVFKIYVDKIGGTNAGHAVHIGYGVGRRWFNAYRPVEVLAS